MQLPPFPAVPKPELSWLRVRATCTQQAVPVPLQCHCAICQAAVRVRAELVLGEGSKLEAWKQKVRVWLEGSKGLARHWLSSGRHQGLPMPGGLSAAPGGAPRTAPAASGRVSSWGMTCGRCGTEGLCSFLKEKGAGSQVLSCWAVWEGGGTCCPSCMERAESSQMSSHPSLPLQLPFAHTIMMICFADAFPGTNTHFQRPAEAEGVPFYEGADG